MRDIIVIGAGTSGLVAAIVCARAGKEVTLLEHNEIIGRKLQATGNGKCNFTNAVQRMDCYRGSVPSFAFSLIQEYGPEVFLQFLESIGIYAKNKNGYYYPYSEQASAMVDAFKSELEHLKIKVKFRDHVRLIKPQKDGYCVVTETYEYEAKKVILSCGGQASPVFGADGSGYHLAAELGHPVTALFPALTGLIVAGQKYGKLAGIRAQARIKLLREGETVTAEQGEIQFTSYGISGIPVFQISRFAGEAFLHQEKVETDLCLLPDLSRKELTLFLTRQKEVNGHKSLKQVMKTYMDPKMAELLIENASIKSKQKIGELTEEEMSSFIGQIRHFRIPIKAVNSFEKAQATAGGVALAQVNEKTMESKIHPGIYFTGEILDVDGTCGGYNIQWAFSSGYAAAKAASADHEPFNPAL